MISKQYKFLQKILYSIYVIYAQILHKIFIQTNCNIIIT